MKKANKKNLEQIFTQPLVRLFEFVSGKVSYTFAVAFLTSLGGFLIAAYIGTFIASTVKFHLTNSGDEFIRLFIILCAFEYAPLYFLHFGIFSKLGIGAFSKKLRFINRHLDAGLFQNLRYDDELLTFYDSVEAIPRLNMVAAGIYPSIVMLAVTIQELMIGSLINALFIFIGISSAIIIYVFYTYVIAELLTGNLRRKIKRLLVMRRISFQEKCFSSIRKKFVFISFLVFIAMVELALMLINADSQQLRVMPWLYIFLTVVVVGSLLFFYMISIEDSLKEIESAALDLGKGGKGKLFGRSMDREFIEMSKGIISAAYEVNAIRNNLEHKVKERTQELQETLSEIRKLKEKQDGDYFLTSLLTDALSNINHAKNENVKISFFVKEKKEFFFRKWHKEIGGDMCMAYAIQLRGKLYSMFLNADAMGKSIQGAGGVLVMGSVVKSLVEQTKDPDSKQSVMYPEQWIKDTFMKLQRIFESFDGSMLMSMVMGLVDDETGLVYFINAEHPWTILYRDGKASFVENELTFHKIGTQGLDISFWVQTFLMKTGDCLIVGSDGRDDLDIGIDQENGLRIINEDETKILEHIEHSKGDLLKMVKNILNFGQLTDDLSLIKISYTKKSASGINQERDEKQNGNRIENTNLISYIDDAKKEILQGNTHQALEYLQRGYEIDSTCNEIMEMLIKVYRRMGDYSKVLFFAEKYLYNNPDKNSYLYLASLAAKKVGNYHLAAEMGERLRLRNPGHLRNLINLVEIYRCKGDNKSARQCLNRSLEIDPTNIIVLKIDKELKQT